MLFKEEALADPQKLLSTTAVHEVTRFQALRTGGLQK